MIMYETNKKASKEYVMLLRREVDQRNDPAGCYSSTSLRSEEYEWSMKMKVVMRPPCYYGLEIKKWRNSTFESRLKDWKVVLWNCIRRDDDTII